VICQIDGCNNVADWWVERPDRQAVRFVCGKCRDELMAVFGYRLFVYGYGWSA
jgi:hypothetical protein